MQTETLNELYIDEIKDIYHAEKQTLKALPKLAKQASSEKLRAAFEEHLEQTKGQVARLEEVFELLDMKPSAKKCDGMEGILKEGDHVAKELEEGATLDAALIAGAQKVEHYEIASYGCARTWATLLGYDDQAKLLAETLEEEKLADQKLTELAEEAINAEAAAGTEETEAPKRGSNSKRRESGESSETEAGLH